MKRKKPLIITFSILLLLFAFCWYLFLKPWDYKILFTVKSPVSVVYSGIQDWHEWNGKTIHKGDIVFSEEIPWKQIKTTLVLNDTILHFDWQLKQKNDSITQVSVGISDADRKMNNRTKILFTRSVFEKSTKENVKILRNKLKELSESYNFNYTGPDSLAEIPCVYISSKSTVSEKAEEMIKNVIHLNLYVKDNQLGLNGNPMVEVKNWSPESDSIYFDFCFPVLHPERMVPDPEIKFKTISMKKAIACEFNGNYSISDLSWNLLFEKATDMNSTSTGRIVEIYYNDPHSGGNDLKWKAEIYMEIL